MGNGCKRTENCCECRQSDMRIPDQAMASDRSVAITPIRIGLRLRPFKQRLRTSSQQYCLRIRLQSGIACDAIVLAHRRCEARMRECVARLTLEESVHRGEGVSFRQRLLHSHGGQENASRHSGYRSRRGRNTIDWCQDYSAASIRRDVTSLSHVPGRCAQHSYVDRP